MARPEDPQAPMVAPDRACQGPPADPGDACDRDGWLPAALNQGWIYQDRVPSWQAGESVIGFYAGRHRHSSAELWRQRLAEGQIRCNGLPLQHDTLLADGDRLAWHRPPWLEDPVPARWSVVLDDGDLLVIDKPSGLPVLPAGGWLEHTVLRLLERRHGSDPAGIPRPVHRLGRFTSGLLVCARRPGSRAWLSRQLRESTAAAAAPQTPGSPSADAAASLMARDFKGHQEASKASGVALRGFRKRYRALLVPGVLSLQPGESLQLQTPIGRRPHPRLGQIWCAADGSDPGDLPARSILTLLECSPAADLVEVAIASGRPHQIRIHCAALGAPLLGDPLYGPGGGAQPGALPGDGGYRLQAWRLMLPLPTGDTLELAVARPLCLVDSSPRGGC